MVDSPVFSLIKDESSLAPFPSAAAMTEHLKDCYAPGVRAVVFYGSCLRLGTDKDLMLDFYVLVDSLYKSIKHPLSAAAGAVLPPNVYYHEIEFEGRVVRAKVAVMTLGAFVRATAPTTFASAIWARFSQPSSIVFATDTIVREAVEKALARAVVTMISKALPLLKGPFSIREMWVTALRATYGAELRPEAPTKADELFDLGQERFNAVGVAALTELGVDPDSPRFPKPLAKWAWRLRGVWGRFLNVLRLLKAAFTFKGGLDYAVWKMERHSGQSVELTAEDRARPLRTGLRLLFRPKK